MSSSSVTGKGSGESNKATLSELVSFANGPAILLTGTIELVGEDASPPAASNGVVVFPKPFSGAASNYAVFLTGISTGTVQVVTMNESGGNFIGFTASSAYEGTIMYLVTKIGVRPS